MEWLKIAISISILLRGNLRHLKQKMGYYLYMYMHVYSAVNFCGLRVCVTVLFVSEVVFFVQAYIHLISILHNWNALPE